MKIAESLKRFRLQFGYTQSEVADKIGVMQQMYYKYEAGKNIPSAEVIVKIAAAFNVSADYLLGLSDIPSNSTGEEVFKAAMEFTQIVNQAINRPSINRPSVHTP